MDTSRSLFIEAVSWTPLLLSFFAEPTGPGFSDSGAAVISVTSGSVRRLLERALFMKFIIVWVAGNALGVTYTG